MNLYLLHDKPEDLHKHKEADATIPAVFWIKYSHNRAALKEREDSIAKHPAYAFDYALYLNKGAWPKGEPALLKSPEFAQMYANYVLEKPWPAGEDIIATNGTSASEYAIEVLKKPWPKGEPAIARNATASEYYLKAFPERTEQIEDLF